MQIASMVDLRIKSAKVNPLGMLMTVDLYFTI
jgi:hypothetical protein